MIEGLYSVTFGTPAGDVGGGVVVFSSGKVQGGDLTYFYVGDLTSTGTDMIDAVVHVEKYQEAGESVFGNLRSFQLHLNGRAFETNFVLSGQIVGNPSARITVQCRKLT